MKSKFKPGVSGNPAGRQRGSGTIGKLRESIYEHVPEIITKLVEQAKAGDAASARLLIERVIPAMKPSEQPAPITLPEGTLTDQGRAVLIAAGTGELAPGQAAQLLAGLGAMSRLIETDELTRRIEELEKQHSQKPQP